MLSGFGKQSTPEKNPAIAMPCLGRSSIGKLQKAHWINACSGKSAWGVWCDVQSGVGPCCQCRHSAPGLGATS